MDPATVAGLDGLVSKPRFSRYLDECSNDPNEARRLYTWQAALASAVWGPIAIFEVVLRNALHSQLEQRTGRGDWWNSSSVNLMPREIAQLKDAQARAYDSAVRRAGGVAANVAPPTPGHVVAASSLGLWVGLLSAGIARDPLYSYETTLWQPRLSKAFPHIGSKKRKQLHDECTRIQYVRNRIAHHEFLAPVETANACTHIEAIVGAVEPSMQRFVASASRVKRIIGNETAWRSGTAQVYYL